MDLISVILTTYNPGETITRTISSILNQRGIGELFDLELIIVDDCSTDNTPVILEQMGLEFTQTPKNTGGPNAGRNIGLQLAKGDYICIADHDDVWEPDKIQATLPYMEKVPIVTSGYRLVDILKDVEEVRGNTSEEGYLYFEKNKTFIARFTKKLSGQSTYLGSIMFSKDLKDVCFEEHFGMVDYDWYLRLFHQRDSIEVCRPLYTRFVEGSNLSLNESYRAKDFYYSLMFIEKYLDQYPSEVRTAYRRIHGSRARYYYLIGKMKRARFFFRKAGFGLKTVLYILTSYWGADFVRKKFNVFG